MEELFKNKYRIDTIRLPGYDYSQPGWYFITICTKDRVCYFGNITNEQMILSDIGLIVMDEWLKTEQIRDNVKLDEWIIMPNHLHGVIQILDNTSTHDDGTATNDNTSMHVETPRRGVSTDAVANKNNIETTNPHHKPQWKSGCLGAIINQFKSKCTKRIWMAGHPNFKWQPRFYDRIVRSEIALMNIRRYIIENPQKWHRDRNNLKGIFM